MINRPIPSGLASMDSDRRIRVMSIFMVIAVLATAFMSPILLFVYHTYLLGWIDAACGIAVLGAYIYLRLTRKIRVPITIIGICCLAFIPLFVLWQGFGIYFLAPSIILIFLITKHKAGLILVGGMLLPLVVALTLASFGVFSLPYSLLTYTMILIASGLTVMLAYFYALLYDRLTKQLAMQKDSIEHTVEIRTQELREAQKKLETADQLKSEFILLTSHNLRTPLSIVSGSAELLQSTTLDDQQKTYVQKLEGSIKRLHNYVEDLLLIASIEAGGQPEMKAISINEVIAPLVEETRELAHDKNIAFSFDTTADSQVQVTANISRLQSAIRHILDNAIKFTDHGSVELHVDNYDHKVVVSVRDTGIGIAEEEIPRLFTKFHRATSTMRYSYEGAGIGLSLVKLIINEHGGEVTLRSKLNEGSIFFITLPQIETNPTAQ